MNNLGQWTPFLNAGHDPAQAVKPAPLTREAAPGKDGLKVKSASF
jgi:hypothetical protein